MKQIFINKKLQKVRYSYDKKHDILYIKVKNVDYFISTEIYRDFILDFGKNGEFSGVRIFDISKKLRGRKDGIYKR